MSFTYDQLKHAVQEYTDNHGWDDGGVQQMIDDGYEDMLKRRLAKTITGSKS